MSRLLIVACMLLVATSCSQSESEPSASGDAADSGSDIQVTEAGKTDAKAVAAKTLDEIAGGDARNREDSEASDQSKGRLRDKYEDEVTTRIGRAILDVMDEEGGGTDEERDAVIATLILKDEELHRASGRRAQQLILRNNNRRRRSLYVPPPPE